MITLTTQQEVALLKALTAQEMTIGDRSELGTLTANLTARHATRQQLNAMLAFMKKQNR